MQQQEDDAELTRRTDAVDGKSMAADSYTRLLSVLAAGDAAVFVLFAAIGRGSHDTDTGNALTTAAPFLAAWAALAPPLGAYPARASRSNEQAAKALQHRQCVKALGSAPARLLSLLRARQAALSRVALPGREAGPMGAQPLPRLLERAASKAADFPRP